MRMFGSASVSPAERYWSSLPGNLDEQGQSTGAEAWVLILPEHLQGGFGGGAEAVQTLPSDVLRGFIRRLQRSRSSSRSREIDLRHAIMSRLGRHTVETPANLARLVIRHIMPAHHAVVPNRPQSSEPSGADAVRSAGRYQPSLLSRTLTIEAL